MEDMRTRLAVALILSYKTSTHTKKRENRHPRNKLERKTQEKQKSRERLNADRGEIIEINWELVFLILFLFSIYS